MGSVGKVAKASLILLSTSQNLDLVDVFSLSKLCCERDNRAWNQVWKTGLSYFLLLSRAESASPNVTKMTWVSDALDSFCCSCFTFHGALDFSVNPWLTKARFQVGEGFRRKTMLLSYAWHFTWEMGITTRNYCEFLISSEKALCLNCQKLKIGRLILLDRDVTARVGKAFE